MQLSSSDMTHRALLLAFPAVTLLLCLWAAAIIVDSPPYLGIELLGNGNIHDVDPDGPAAKAGLQLGDQVMEVGGIPLHAALSLYRGKSPGEPIALAVRRQGTEIRTEAVLGTVTPWEYTFRIERLFVGLIFWIVGLAGWLLRPHKQAARLFLVFSQVAAGMLFAEILDPGIPAMSILTDHLRYLVAPLLLHLFATFPTPLSDPLRAILLRTVYGGYLLLTLVLAATLLLSHSR